MKQIFEVCAEEFDDYLRLVEVKEKYGGVCGGEVGGENKEVPEHVHCIRQPLMNTTLLVPATTLFILDSFAVQG